MAREGVEGGGSSGDSCGGGRGGNPMTRGGRDGCVEVDGDREVDDKLGEGGGTGEGGFCGGASVRRIHMSSGGTNPQGEWGLLRYLCCDLPIIHGGIRGR